MIKQEHILGDDQHGCISLPMYLLANAFFFQFRKFIKKECDIKSGYLLPMVSNK